MPATSPGRLTNDLDRPPYRGLRPLEAEDAGIFFGRDGRSSRRSTPCVACARPLRRGSWSFSARPVPANRRSCAPACFRGLRVTTAISCRCRRSGRSGRRSAARPACFLRSKPRLRRPGFRSRAPTCGRSSRPAPSSSSRSCKRSPIRRRPGPQRTPSLKPKPPTLILSIDQAEELFLAEAADEARSVSCLAARSAQRRCTRTHRRFHDPLRQLRDDFNSPPNWKACARTRSALPPMPKGSYAEVIKGPARRLEGTKRRARNRGRPGQCVA